MSSERKNIVPSVSLKEIFGPNHVLNPRASFSNYGWITNNPITLDFITGSPLAFTGDLPIICSKSVTSNEAISLLRSAYIEIAPNRYEYLTKNDYTDLLHLLKSQNQKLVFNHLHPEDEIEPELYWINPQIIAYLNNKANIGELVSKNHIPKRIVIAPNELTNLTNFEYPVVIKGASDKPNGGGLGVFICKTKEDLVKKQKYFETCDFIVVEDFIPIKINYNVQFAKTFDGSILYLGASEQITSKAGYYLGNWLEKENTPPEAVINLGMDVMDNACSLGYYGIAGLDIVLDENDHAFVIDLNFRLNGSTSALLLHDSIFERHNVSTLLFRPWKSRLPFTRFIPACQKVISEGGYIPFSVFNPKLSPYQYAYSRLSGVFIGNSRDQIINKTLPHFRKQLKT